MKVKDFIALIDIESMADQEINFIIPIKERMNDLQNDSNIGDCNLSDNEKVIVNSDEFSIYDSEKYENYGIEPCFCEDVQSMTLDVKSSKDGYHFVYNEDGEIWVII